MMKIYAAVTLVFFSFLAQAKTSFIDSVERLEWGDLEVVWIEDNKFPKFTASIFYKDGAISDAFPGVTQATFDQLSSGTSKHSQKEIAEFFDFYGVNFRHSVTHEYSIYTVQALTKDIAPVMGKVCELMNDAQYPTAELKSYVSRSKSHLKNLVTSHAALADRVFRAISLKGTPFEGPVKGTLESFDKLSPQILKERMKALNKTKKVLYLAGPESVKKMRSVLSEKCNWSNENQAKDITLSKPQSQSSIYLVAVPGANQAQIRVGRYLTEAEVEGKYDQFGFLASFLGGGFTSKLVQELRVKRGLTYSAGAYVSILRDYGRAGVTTFSKNETTAEAIALIREVLHDLSSPKKIAPPEFKHMQGHEIGGYAFRFEKTSAFLSQLMLYDHQGRSFEELEKYPERIAKLTERELAQADFEVFPWDKMTVVVVGDASLVKELSRIRPVRIVDYEDFL